MSAQGTAAGKTAIVGTGSRAAMFLRGLVARAQASQLKPEDRPAIVAFCEPNPVRAEYYNEILESLGAPRVPIYPPERFKEMLENEKVDVVIITCVDALHDLYIVPALEAKVRVITEKPMTTDIEKCRRILETVQRTHQHLTVTFNYRYNPVHELVKKTIRDGEIGEVISVHFEWLLDTVHGADYFRRWHRQKTNSGGLMVHKSGHHFDLVNWWINAEPETVAGFGKLAFYGKEAGEKHGWAKQYERARGSEEAKTDPFAIHLEGKGGDGNALKRLYADAEQVDGYHRDMNVFAPGIGIEDDMSVIVRYNTGATLTYHLTTYSPWEGYRVMFNGSHGRLELEVVESEYRSVADGKGMDGLIHGNQPLPHPGGVRVTLQKLWEKPVNLDVVVNHAAHGGGDQRMLNVLFGPLPGEAVEAGDASKQGANERDGAMALAVGLLANKSFKSGKFEHFKDLGLPL